MTAGSKKRSAAELAYVNGQALLKRRLQVDATAGGMTPEGSPLHGDDRAIRLQFEEAVHEGTRSKAEASRFFAELEANGWTVPVASLLLHDTFFVSAIDALPEARTFLASALLSAPPRPEPSPEL